MALLQIGKRRKAPPRLVARVYLSVSSEGYGHSSRALAIAKQYQGGPDDILIGTYSYALDRVRSFGHTCVEVPQEIKFVGAEGSFDVGKTILQNPTAPLEFNQIIQHEMNIIKSRGISLVVADGRMAPVLAAERLDLPCLVMTNQSAYYPFFEQNSALVKLFGRSFEWVMKLWLCSAEEILIPDFAPPHTVCLPNLSQNYQVKKRTRFVGPLVPWQAHEVRPVERHPHRPLIVASLGGHGYRRPLFDAVLQVARKLPDIDFIVFSSFRPATALPDNVQLTAFVKETAPYFKAANLVITQAGHSTAMELLTLGVPSIVVPDARQIEQENNAERLEDLGVSSCVTYDGLMDAEQGLLRSTLLHMLETPAYRHRALELAAMAERIHGARHAAEVLQEYSHRLIAY